jgi:hypothetical protein
MSECGVCLYSDASDCEGMIDDPRRQPSEHR